MAALRSTTEAEQAAIRARAEAERAQLRAAADAERAELQSAAEAEKAAAIAALENEHASTRSDIESKLQEAQTRYATDTGALRDALNGSLERAGPPGRSRWRPPRKTPHRKARSLRRSSRRSPKSALRTRDVWSNSRPTPRRVWPSSKSEAPTSSAHTRRASQSSNRPTPPIRPNGTRRRPPPPRTPPNATRYTRDRSPSWNPRTPLGWSNWKPPCRRPPQRADDALAAVQRAEEAFGAERQRLEDALLAAVDGERAAKHALSTEIASRTVAERGQRQMQQAIERFAKDAGVSVNLAGGGAPPPPAKVTTTTKVLADRLNNELPRRLGDGLSLQLLAAGGDVPVAVEESTRHQRHRHVCRQPPPVDVERPRHGGSRAGRHRRRRRPGPRNVAGGLRAGRDEHRGAGGPAGLPAGDLRQRRPACAGDS